VRREENLREWELWPSRFLKHPNQTELSLTGWPPSQFLRKETRQEIHKRLGQRMVRRCED
jgi:hypothetical protein